MNFGMPHSKNQNGEFIYITFYLLLNTAW